MNLFLEIARLAAVGLIAGVFSAILANRDYKNRAWWEMRVLAYKAVIEALSDLVYYYDTHYNAEIERRELPEDFKKKLDDFWETAFPNIRKAADSGAFLFSDVANAALLIFISACRERNEHFFEHLDSRLFAAKTCLHALVDASRNDLKLHHSFLDRLT